MPTPTQLYQVYGIGYFTNSLYLPQKDPVSKVGVHPTGQKEHQESIQANNPVSKLRILPIGKKVFTKSLQEPNDPVSKVGTLPAKKVSPRECSNPTISCRRWPNVILKRFHQEPVQEEIGNHHVFTKVMTLLPNLKGSLQFCQSQRSRNRPANYNALLLVSD